MKPSFPDCHARVQFLKREYSSHFANKRCLIPSTILPFRLFTVPNTLMDLCGYVIHASSRIVSCNIVWKNNTGLLSTICYQPVPVPKFASTGYSFVYHRTSYASGNLLSAMRSNIASFFSEVGRRS